MKMLNTVMINTENFLHQKNCEDENRDCTTYIQNTRKRGRTRILQVRTNSNSESHQPSSSNLLSETIFLYNKNRRRTSSSHQQSIIFLFFSVMSVLFYSKRMTAIVSNGSCRYFCFIFPEIEVIAFEQKQSFYRNRRNHPFINTQQYNVGLFDRPISSTRRYTTSPSVQSRQEYKNLTVKELRQAVKLLPNSERGLLSKLVKKDDLINHLLDNGNSVRLMSSDGSSNGNFKNSQKEENADGALNEKGLDVPNENPVHFDEIRSNGLTVPTTKSAFNDAELSATNKKELSKRLNLVQMPSMPTFGWNEKDLILEAVFKRYPTLKELYNVPVAKQYQVENDDSPDDDDDDDDDDNLQSSSVVYRDIRQKYHPIFQRMSQSRDSTTTPTDSDPMDSVDEDLPMQTYDPINNITSSDLDIVFVGTASCTPGATRGTSCTAIRLRFKSDKRFHDTNGSIMRQKKKRFDNMNDSIDESRVDGTQRNEYSTHGVSGTWLFDCGECTQLQVQSTPGVRPSKITKIFLTHAHGDHTFGLPGLLCMMGARAREPDEPPIEIFGPEGLRMWLRVAIRYSVSRVVPSYVVHELMDIPMAPEWEFHRKYRKFFYKGDTSKSIDDLNYKHGPWKRKGVAGEDPSSWISLAKEMQLEPSILYGELQGGRNIYPDYNHPKSSDGAPVWHVITDDLVNVYAAPMSHSIPCVGYCIDEAPRQGRLRNEVVAPIVERNFDALKAAGIKSPIRVMGILKNLKEGTAFTFPDGTVVTNEEAVEAPRMGRKIVICGDTADARAMSTMAQNADVIIHESTNAFLPGVDKGGSTLNDVTRDCILHGHSTPQMAGEFCKSVNGKKLVLNHFSSRYKGDTMPESLSIMLRIEQQAIRASGLDETKVAAAWDNMLLPVPAKDSTVPRH